MGIRDKLRRDAAQYLRPGEQIQAVFLARRPSMQANDRAVVATDQRLLLMKLSFVGRATGLVGEAPRMTRLGPATGVIHVLDAFGEPLAVAFRFFSDIADADRGVGYAAGPGAEARAGGREICKVIQSGPASSNAASQQDFGDQDDTDEDGTDDGAVFAVLSVEIRRKGVCSS